MRVLQRNLSSQCFKAAPYFSRKIAMESSKWHIAKDRMASVAGLYQEDGDASVSVLSSDASKKILGWKSKITELDFYYLLTNT